MLPQDVLHHGGRGEREDRRRLRHSLSRPRGACPLRCARLGRFRLKWAAEFKLLRSPLMGADGFCFCVCVVVLWEGSGYNGGVGEVGALWPPRFLCLLFFRLFSSLKIVVSEVEILPPFRLLSSLCFRRSAVFVLSKVHCDHDPGAPTSGSVLWENGSMGDD